MLLESPLPLARGVCQVGWLVCNKLKFDNRIETVQIKKGKDIKWIRMYKFESLNFKVGDTIKILPIKTDVK